MDEHENNIRDRFIDAVRKFDCELKKDYEKYKENQTKTYLHRLKKKYPHLKGIKGGDSKILEGKALVMEIIDRKDLGYEFTNDDKKEIYTYCVDKTQGIFKHAQAFKTGYCNLLIINGISEEKTISICITKNTLESNAQWLQRIFKEVNHRYPHVKTNKQILVISSKKDDMGGNATYCKDLDTAWKLLRKADSQIKMIFICSNKTRLKDTLDLLDRITDLRESIQHNFRILHDEAHNSTEGIPPYRSLVEHIVLHPNVLSYTPITATNHPIIDETNPLWRKENIEGKARNYTEFDNTKSSDPQYSSCSDAIQKTFETIPNWHDYGITKIPIKNFMRVHGKEFDKVKYKYTPEELRKELQAEIRIYIDSRIESDEIDICEIRKKSIEYTDEQCIEAIINVNVERRRTLEFCNFMERDQEVKAVNNGLNCLNMNRLLGIDYFQSDVFNLHIISTPNRNVITDYLCDHAIQTIPRVIVLGIYGNEGDKYHLFMGNDCEEVSHIMNSGEFNMKLEKLFIHLRSRNVDLNGPFILLGNYKPTGESLTFVNSSYGTVRGNIRLISTNAEEHYQEACRANYMTTKFVEDPNWVMPVKFLVGTTKFIEDVNSYERENDARIDFLAARENIYETTIDIPDNSQSVSDGNRIGIVAIPIKLEMDFTSEPVKEIVEILKTKRNRTKEEKSKILSLLKKGMENDDIIVYDQTGKWKNDIDRFTLEFVRGYTKPSNAKDWRFESYQNCHEMKTGYINNTTAIKPNECELLACIDPYRNGSFVNPKLRWWIGYKYA